MSEHGCSVDMWKCLDGPDGGYIYREMNDAITIKMFKGI